MGSLAAVFFDIALHRCGPDRLPSTPFLVALLLVVYFPVNLLRLYLSGAAASFDYLFVFLDTALFFAFVYGALHFFKKTRRFRQTVSALLGTDILINLIGLPVSAAGASMPESTLLSLVYLALFLWWIDIAGFIISRAVEQPYVVGIMFVIFYVVAALSILSSFSQSPA